MPFLKLRDGATVKSWERLLLGFPFLLDKRWRLINCPPVDNGPFLGPLRPAQLTHALCWPHVPSRQRQNCLEIPAHSKSLPVPPPARGPALGTQQQPVAL